MKAIITGGAGFIGSHAVRYFLNCNDDIINVDKLTYAGNEENTKLSTFIKLDICDTKNFLQVAGHFRPEIIIHFAAETHVDNSIENCKDFVKTNVEGTASILDVCRKKNIKLCHISTDEVYGPATDKAFNEEDRLNPMNPYAATKAAAESMIRAYHNTYGIEYIIVRPSNNYGPGQHQEKFIPKLLNCIKKNKEFTLYGAGDQEREWTFVKDTVKKIHDLITCEKVVWNGVYNLSSGITMSNIDAAKKIVHLYNEKNNTTFKVEDIVKQSKDRPGHDKKYWISSKKLDSILCSDYTNFDTGIREVLRYTS